LLFFFLDLASFGISSVGKITAVLPNLSLHLLGKVDLGDIALEDAALAFMAASADPPLPIFLNTHF
jgi:hypothetical protein